MRYVCFDDNHLGILDGDDIIDVTDQVRGAGPAGPLHRMIEMGGVDPVGPRIPVSSVELGAPLPRPGKVVAAPVNYRDHQVEMREQRTIAEYGVFLKAPSSVIGPQGTVQLPYLDVRTDHEAELAVVIGRTADDVGTEHALEYVFGYTCALDMTVRSTEDRSTRKSFNTFTPLGPAVVTADEVGDPGTLELECRVGGQVRQRVSTAELLLSVPELVAYASSVMTLWPGDVILTGTPAGVGPVEDGDVIEVAIDRVGLLLVGVSAAGARPYAQRPGAARWAVT